MKYCYEDEDLEHVARNMAGLRVRRLPVLSREKRLVGNRVARRYRDV